MGQTAQATQNDASVLIQGLDDAVFNLEEAKQIEIEEDDSVFQEEENSQSTDTIRLMMNDITSFPRLTPEEELHFGLMLKGTEAERKEAVHALVNHNLRLVVMVAKKYRTADYPLNDAVQDGALGLYRAAEKFDTDMGCKFSTYATWWIRQSILNSRTEFIRMIRIPRNMDTQIWKINKAREKITQQNMEPTPEAIAEESGLPLQEVRHLLGVPDCVLALDKPASEADDSNPNAIIDFIADDYEKNPESMMIRQQVNEGVRKVVDTLPEKERDVIRRRFGIGTKAMTLEEIGTEYGVTRERIRQIELKALRHLKMGKYGAEMGKLMPELVRRRR